MKRRARRPSRPPPSSPRPAAAFADATIQAVDGTGPTAATTAGRRTRATVKVGETVTWTFAGTDDRAQRQVRLRHWDSRTTPDPGRRRPTSTYTFTTPGTYEFFCQLHAPTMRGTVTVTDEAGTPPPPPPPPPLSEQPFANDCPAPTILEVRDTIAPKLDRVAVTRVAQGRAGALPPLRGRQGHDQAHARGKAVKTPHRRGAQGHVVASPSTACARAPTACRSAPTDLAGNAARAPKRARVTVRS